MDVSTQIGRLLLELGELWIPELGTFSYSRVSCKKELVTGEWQSPHYELRLDKSNTELKIPAIDPLKLNNWLHSITQKGSFRILGFKVHLVNGEWMVEAFSKPKLIAFPVTTQKENIQHLPKESIAKKLTRKKRSRQWLPWTLLVLALLVATGLFLYYETDVINRIKANKQTSSSSNWIIAETDSPSLVDQLELEKQKDSNESGSKEIVEKQGFNKQGKSLGDNTDNNPKEKVPAIAPPTKGQSERKERSQSDDLESKKKPDPRNNPQKNKSSPQEETQTLKSAISRPNNRGKKRDEDLESSQPKMAQNSTLRYYVVYGCFEVLSNAEKLKSQLRSKGRVANLKKSNKNGLNQVLESFSTKSEALKQRHAAIQLGYEDCWVYWAKF